MKYAQLGRTDIKVSEICLGTMTFGEQNTAEDGFAQLDYALDHGVNFIDTAEMYSVPPKPETYGATETIIGDWLAARSNRDKFILASKVVGPGFDHIRDGNTAHTRANVTAAVEASLKRLKTDYIDLYQIHWPDRATNYFGKLGYVHDDEASYTPQLETLETLNDMVKQGKIRAIGLSNETAWGAMHYLSLAEKHGLPRMASIQNPYNLLNRSYEVGLAEVSMREDCGLLAYSPLGFGALSGKYLDGAQPQGARLTLFPEYSRYTKPAGIAATQRYVQIARDHGLDPVSMALAFVNEQPFVTSNIIGATTMEQLKTNIASIDIVLNDDIRGALNEVHVEISNPSP